MIDLRSDTLTLPDAPMLEAILTAKLGDDGRQDAQGRGEDQATNELENVGARLVGKEEGLLLASGTLANSTAIFTYCKPGDRVMVDPLQHIYKTEKVAFSPSFGQMEPVFYRFTEESYPDLGHMEEIVAGGGIRLICVENSHNFTGGSCVPLDIMQGIRAIADRAGIPVHLDGARLFNAAQGLGVEAREICRYVDSVMFCLSKGLGAPVGSLLCGSGRFIREARATRKLLGGNLRQSGIIAAPGLYALEHNIARLAEDAEHAAAAAAKLAGLTKGSVQKRVDSNIVVIDTAASGITAEEYCARAHNMGLWIRPVLGDHVRLVFYKGITMEDALEAAEILLALDRQL